MRQEDREFLIHELGNLMKAAKLLRYSYDKCMRIAMNDEFDIEELDGFEALTSRFARTSDILVQKMFRLLDIIELQPEGTPIDMIHRAEKRGLIEDAETIKDARRLRNTIAHEYKHDALEALFKQVMELTPAILDCIDRVQRYVGKIVE